MRSLRQEKPKTIRLDDVDPGVSELVGDAAKRKGMGKHEFIKTLLEGAASKEYAIQQQETARSGEL